MRICGMLVSGLLTLALAVTSSAAWAQNDPSFRLHNRGSVDIIGVTVGGYGVLNQGVLAPGQHILIRLPAGQCSNAYQVLYRNGAVLNIPQLNSCVLDDLDAGFEINASAATAPQQGNPYQQPRIARPAPANCVPRGSCFSQCGGIAYDRSGCINSCMLRQCP